MGTRKLMTISLPPELLAKAKRVAREEHRTRSDLVREALRLYVETRAARREAARERLFQLIGKIQARSAGTPGTAIRRLVGEARGAVRRARPRSTA